MFEPAADDVSFRRNAVQWPGGNDATIGAGFIEIADIAVKHWAHVGPNDLLLLPIIYNYRQGLELLLKEAIRRAAHCLREDGHADDELQPERLESWLAQRAGHQLRQLANRLDSYLARLNEQTLPADTIDILEAVHDLDPGGDTFRYTTTWSKQDGRHVPAPRPDSTHIDVVAMGERFHEAANLIGGGVLSILQEYSDAQRYYGG
jgi:hypothetical protein